MTCPLYFSSASLHLLFCMHHIKQFRIFFCLKLSRLLYSFNVCLYFNLIKERHSSYAFYTLGILFLESLNGILARFENSTISVHKLCIRRQQLVFNSQTIEQPMEDSHHNLVVCFLSSVEVVVLLAKHQCSSESLNWSKTSHGFKSMYNLKQW